MTGQDRTRQPPGTGKTNGGVNEKALSHLQSVCFKRGGGRHGEVERGDDAENEAGSQGSGHPYHRARDACCLPRLCSRPPARLETFCPVQFQNLHPHCTFQHLPSPLYPP